MDLPVMVTEEAQDICPFRSYSMDLIIGLCLQSELSITFWVRDNQSKWSVFDLSPVVMALYSC